jgi:hypothetical protein
VRPDECSTGTGPMLDRYRAHARPVSGPCSTGTWPIGQHAWPALPLCNQYGAVPGTIGRMTSAVSMHSQHCPKPCNKYGLYGPEPAYIGKKIDHWPMGQGRVLVKSIKFVKMVKMVRLEHSCGALSARCSASQTGQTGRTG